jgi:hypothetical protein
MGRERVKANLGPREEQRTAACDIPREMLAQLPARCPANDDLRAPRAQRATGIVYTA